MPMAMHKTSLTVLGVFLTLASVCPAVQVVPEQTPVEYRFEQGDIITLSLKNDPSHVDTLTVGDDGSVKLKGLGRIQVAGFQIGAVSRAFAKQFIADHPGDTLVVRVQTTAGRVIKASVAFPMRRSVIPIPVASVGSPVPSRKPAGWCGPIAWCSVMGGLASIGGGAASSFAANEAYDRYLGCVDKQEADAWHERAVTYERMSYALYGVGALSLITGGYFFTFRRDQSGGMYGLDFRIREERGVPTVDVACRYRF
jgi:hypothetical protein